MDFLFNLVVGVVDSFLQSLYFLLMLFEHFLLVLLLFFKNFFDFEAFFSFVEFSLFISNFRVKIKLSKFFQNKNELLKVKVSAVRRYFFEKLDDLLFLNDFPDTIIFHFDGSKVEIFQKYRKPVNSKMNFFVLESIKCHMFASFENVGTVVLENKLEVIDSFEGDQLLAVLELFFKTKLNL